MTLTPENNNLKRSLVEDIKQYRQALAQTGLQPELNRLVLGERERLMQLLTAQGYYRAEINYDLIDERFVGESIFYQINLGPQYQVLSVSHSGDVVEQTVDLSRGMPLVAKAVIDASQALANDIRNNACYFQVDSQHRVRLDHQAQGGHVDIEVTAKLPSTIGEIIMSGDLPTGERYLRRQTGLRQGECYRQSDIDQAVLNLYQTQLFANVQRSLTRQDNGQVDITFRFIKRPPRSIDAAIGWDTSEQINVELAWQHRNLFGLAQWLEIASVWQLNRQSLSTSLTLPGFQSANNTLILATELTHETPDASEYYIAESSATLNRAASRTTTFGYQLGWRYSEERTSDSIFWQSYSLLRLGASVRYDNLPSNLNPSDGTRAQIRLAPVLNLDQQGISFLESQSSWSRYWPVGKRWVLANNLAWQGVWSQASELSQLPESDRLLLGGGGSLRGYPFQSIGFGEQNLPATQALQASVELRAKVSNQWGLTVFADTGMLGDSLTTITEQPLYTGAGIGLRYFTPFAPIRVDVAVPLNRRADDPSYQLYLSLGQAF